MRNATFLMAYSLSKLVISLLKLIINMIIYDINELIDSISQAALKSTFKSIMLIAIRLRDFKLRQLVGV